MCTPEIALGTSAAGGAMNTVGSYYAAKGQQIGLKAQAGLAETNARIAELQAKSALIEGQKEEQNSRLRTANVKGTQRARFGANNVALDSETALNIQTSTDLIGEVDANTIAANAARLAWGYRTQAVDMQNDALLKRAQARGISPLMSAGGSLLTSASSVAKDYYSMKKVGAFQ